MHFGLRRGTCADILFLRGSSQTRAFEGVGRGGSPGVHINPGFVMTPAETLN